MRYAATLAGICSSLAALSALAQDPQDAESWLGRIAAAARDLTYSGTFVHQSGTQMETMRVTHLRDAQGEYEKLEMLDGPPREIVRENETVHCYFPQARVVKQEHGKARRYFPALIGEHPEAISANYAVRLGGTERVAGYECKVIRLQPKDKLRFGHAFCAELRTGLLLKAAIVNSNGIAVEQVAFTALTIGGDMDREAVRSIYHASERQGWRTDPGNWERVAPNEAWLVRDAPAGFRKILEMQRRMQGRSDPVRQIVFSDGLASISVFIEPSARIPNALRGPRQRGVVSVYTRQLADHQITVLGEVPAASLAHLANAVELRK